YSKALISKTVMRSGPAATCTITSPASTSPASRTRKIETGSAMCDEQRGHLWLVHADARAVTSHARLCHFKQSAADPITGADAHSRVGQAVDREVLSELPIGEIVSTKLALRIMVGVELIDEDGAVLTAVPVKSHCPSPSILNRRTMRRP